MTDIPGYLWAQGCTKSLSRYIARLSPHFGPSRHPRHPSPSQPQPRKCLGRPNPPWRCNGCNRGTRDHSSPSWSQSRWDSWNCCAQVILLGENCRNCSSGTNSRDVFFNTWVILSLCALYLYNSICVCVPPSLGLLLPWLTEIATRCTCRSPVRRDRWSITITS